MNYPQWLLEFNIDCHELTPELQAALQMQFEAELRRLAPIAEKLVSTTSCPPMVHCMPTQPTQFDMRAESNRKRRQASHLAAFQVFHSSDEMLNGF